MNNLFENINNRISAIDKIKRHKEIISNGFKIEWETDPHKMQFEKLRSNDSMKDQFNSKILRVEEYDLTSHEYIDIFIGDTQSHMEMIDILLNGGKLIPPSKTEGYAIVDGEEKMVRPSGNVGLTDGVHRCNLAKYFGSKTIPVVVFKTFEGYWFTPEKWVFEGTRIREEEKTEFGMSWTEYSGVKAISKENGKVFTFKEGSSFMNDSNPDYLVVMTHQ